MDLSSVWPLKCGCHDVSPHLAITTALRSNHGGIKTTKTQKFKNRDFGPFVKEGGGGYKHPAAGRFKI